MKKIITLLRHSETEGNKLKILMGGRIDFPLTANGEKIAVSVSKELGRYQFDKVYCSSNQRAKDTLRIALPQPDSEIEITETIKEQDYGKITGMNLAELSTDHQNKFMEDPFYFPHEEGESLYQVKLRIAKFFQDKIEKSPHKNILLVTHENVIRAAIAYMKNLDREVVNLKFDYCSLTKYEYDSGKYTSILFNSKP